MTVSEHLSSVSSAESAATAPTKSASFPIIGIGASAGGIAALQQFFAHTPPDSGMAFVVILHLNPTHESVVATVLQSQTSLPVTQVTETVAIEPNHVYVIPPARQISLVDGSLRLDIPVNEHARHMSINHFFHTLAEAHGPYTAAIVLSGMGDDGVLGVQQIKDHGGITLAQDPEEAKHDTMPRNAVAAGHVDFVLPVAQMPAMLIDCWRAADANQSPADEARPTTDAETIAAILALLSARTGYTFNLYDHETLRQRIERRMQAHGVAELSAYVAVLRTHSDEAQVLLHDLLDCPGSFFRDVDAWHALAAIIPNLFANKQAEDQVRVWVAGCATGEEAYSVAILLHEYASSLDHRPHIRVFATDINGEAVRTARQGLFPETIASDVSPERLQRFFMPEQDRYRIKEEIRELVLFAAHNLLHDPPFAKLDLIVCRNRLHHLNHEVQERLLQLFHFILRPDGYLLLDACKLTDGVPGLFVRIDTTQPLFQRQVAPNGASMYLPALPLFRPPAPFIVEHASKQASPPSFSDLHQQLLAQYASPSVIIDKEHNILHLSGTAGRFLTLHEGAPSRDLLQLIHPDLCLELRAALLEAVAQNRSIEVRRVRIELEGSARLIDMVVHPVQEPEWARGCLMAVFHDLGDASTIARGSASATAPMIQLLETELQRTRAQLHSTVEQYEAAEEEHRATNEELQAINEELHTITAELGAREEDLQSANEELMTINQYLKDKVDEISQANNDLLNLMVSTEIGTIFVDRGLRIKRYTPTAQAIFNLIPGDINRPLAHVTHKLAYDQIIEDAARVLETLTKIEREVLSQDGCCYLARLLPYRTLEDRIDGVILTFVDITERKRAEEALRASEERLQQAIAIETVGVIFFNVDGNITNANNAFLRMSGYSRADLENGLVRWDTQTPPEWMPQSLHAIDELRTLGRTTPYEKEYIRKDGSRWWALFAATRINAEEGVEFIIDITERKQADKRVQFQAQLLDNVEQAVIATDNTGIITFWNRFAEKLYGWTAAEVVGQPVISVIVPEVSQDLAEQIMEHLRSGTTWAGEYTVRRRDGTIFPAFVNDAPIRDENGNLAGVVGVSIDISTRKQTEADLHQALAEVHSARDQLQALSRRLLDVQEAERRMIARELHDQIGQDLTGLSLRLLMIDPHDSAEDIRKHVQETQRQVNHIMSQVRQMSLNLRPPMLDDLGLLPALQWHIKRYTEQTHIQVDLEHVDLEEQRFAPDVEITAYRVVQEALTNVARYAGVDTATVQVWADDEYLHVQIEDHGCGFDTASKMYSSSGLSGMRERVQLLQGTLAIRSVPGDGTRVQATLPLTETSDQQEGSNGHSNDSAGR